MIALEIFRETTAVAASIAPSRSEIDELFPLQLRVARRADELARRFVGGGRESDRRFWLRAECEVFERLQPARA